MQQRDIFKAYDIRGEVGDDGVNPAVMERIGFFFAGLAGAEGVAVGRDCRLSSERLQEAFIIGAARAGRDVLDIGQATTDTVYYAAATEGLAAAVITASHNPPDHNGVKLCRSSADHFSGQDIQLVGERSLAAEALPENATGRYGYRDVLADYAAHLTELAAGYGPVGELKIGLDCGNGMAGPLAFALAENLPVEVFGIYTEPDGNFPNHPANPSDRENLKDLSYLVQRESLDLGVAFDTDADRAVFIDDCGEVLDGDRAAALLARWCLSHHPGETVVYDAIASKTVRLTIEEHGGRALRSRVGFPFIKEALRASGAFFASETSGHYYFRDNFAIDSGAFAMLAMMQALTSAGQPLSILRREFVSYVQSGEQTFKVADRQVAIAKVAACFDAEGEVDHLDGLTVTWPDRWLNLRASNTEPIIRLNVEGANEAAVKDLVGQVGDIVGRD
ncbi:phosphomannomutase/phosphoglucomutase [Candidatus Saccharibacteria bacterium]|nr:phosphomannomutase/phosphoglucomutase [Candidatus Saccharibacteria bacterium]